MMSKIKKISLIVLLLTLTSIVIANSKLNVLAIEEETGPVTQLTEPTTTSILDGITVHEQEISLKFDYTGIPFDTTSQYLVMPSTSQDSRIVSWSYRSQETWTKTGVSEIAEDFEKHNPGWLVVGGVNNDFFDINNTGQMDYHANENGEMIKPVNYHSNTHWRGILGFTKDNELIVGRPTLTNHYNAHVYTDETMLTETSVLQVNQANPTTISETGITVLTKDNMKEYDLTGYKVAVGKYDVVRISYGDVSSIYVKGEIDEIRDGSGREGAKDYITVDGKDVAVKQFLLVSKDGSLDTLKVGDYVKVQKDYTGDYADVINACSYYWKILEDGVSLFKGHTDPETKKKLENKYLTGEGIGDISYITCRKARCMFGVKEDGSYVMCVIDASTSSGPSLSECAEYMKELGCVDAWNFDGGGSATMIARNENGNFYTVNAPSDSGGESERAVGNAMLMVVRDPGFTSVLRDSTATTIKLNKKTNSSIFEKMTDIKIKIDGQIVDVANDQNSVTIENLTPNTSYLATVEYTYDGENYSVSLPVKTRKFNPGISFMPTSDGFVVSIDNSDPVLETIGIALKVGDNSYNIENKETYTITGLLVDSPYDISYTYTVRNKNSGKTFEESVGVSEYRTLSYQTPKINKWEEYSKRTNSLMISYSFEDKDGLVTDKYVLVNGVRSENIIVSSKTGTLNFRNLDFKLNNYSFQLVVEFTDPDMRPQTLKSEILLYEMEECSHTYDNECDTDCNECGLTREITHQYKEADCENPETCTVCGSTNGQPLGHDWTDATYDAPKTCNRCNKTEGDPLEKPEEKKKGCKKSMLAEIILATSLLSASLLIFRKRK